MKRPKRCQWPLMVLFCLLLGGCGAKNTFVLLPDKDGNVGEITVTNSQGTQTLNQARQVTRVVSYTSSPSERKIMGEGQINDLFGRAIEIQPPLPTKFRLYFNFDSVQLTKDSKRKLAVIVQTARDRASQDISVNGHTDRLGNIKYNSSLSMRRAESIQKKLQKLGIDPAIITTTSHGEGNPLIHTKDNRAEPRNRRVEVIVR